MNERNKEKAYNLKQFRKKYNNTIREEENLKGEEEAAEKEISNKQAFLNKTRKEKNEKTSEIDRLNRNKHALSNKISKLREEIKALKTEPNKTTVIKTKETEITSKEVEIKSKEVEIKNKIAKKQTLQDKENEAQKDINEKNIEIKRIRKNLEEKRKELEKMKSSKKILNESAANALNRLKKHGKSYLIRKNIYEEDINGIKTIDAIQEEGPELIYIEVGKDEEKLNNIKREIDTINGSDLSCKCIEYKTIKVNNEKLIIICIYLKDSLKDS